MTTKNKKRPSLLIRDLERRVLREVDQVLPRAWELAHGIFQNPELGFAEFFAADAITAFMAGAGFSVERPVAGLETAFVARVKRGTKTPCVAFLAEMDALPEMGHACGHHLIAGSSAGAAVALSRALPDLKGAIEVIGCPAEEGGGGKIVLADRGVFDHVDAAFIVHPDRRTEVFKRSLGVVEVQLDFKGRAAHAAAEPESGINALDAVLQTFNAVNALRQQLPDKTRVHGIVTHGGVAPNIIPERANAVFLARGLTVSETLEIADKVVACAKGAAQATGAKLRSKVHKQKMFAPYVPNRALGEVFTLALDRLKIEIDDGVEDEGMGSTDVGNAGMRVPVVHPLMRVEGVDEGVHTPAFARAAGSEQGRALLGRAIAANALAGAAVLMDESLRKRAHEEHQSFIRKSLS